MDKDVENISAYAVGVTELSRPEGTLLDFSDADISGGTYVLQYADNASFTGAVTVENVTEKSYRIYNLKLGEKIYWRVGTSLENALNGEVREFTVADKGPRNMYISGVTNVRDIGGYHSSLPHRGYAGMGASVARRCGHHGARHRTRRHRADNHRVLRILSLSGGRGIPATLTGRIPSSLPHTRR